MSERLDPTIFSSPAPAPHRPPPRIPGPRAAGLVAGRAAALAALRARVRALEGNSGPGPGTSAPRAEGGEGAGRGGERLPFGVAALDLPPPAEAGFAKAGGRLPGGGLPLGCLHEIAGARMEWDDGAATGFCLALLARLGIARLGAARSSSSRSPPSRPETSGTLLWVARRRDLYPPGLAAFGLDPGPLILVRAGSEAEVLWAMEEALRCPQLLAVVGELEAPAPAAARRLQLAAKRGGVTAFMLRRQIYSTRRAEAVSAASTRWRIAPAPSGAARGILPGGNLLGRVRWRVELLRCRGAAPGHWLLEWDDATGGFALAAALRDRSLASAPGSSGAETTGRRRTG